MSEETVVTVETEPSEETPTVVDTSDTVVVVTPPANDPVSDPVMDRLMTTDQRLNDLTSAMETLGQTVATLASAQAATIEHVEEVEEVVTEQQLDDAYVEDEIVPETRHVWFRPIRSWFGNE